MYRIYVIDKYCFKTLFVYIKNFSFIAQTNRKSAFGRI